MALAFALASTRTEAATAYGLTMANEIIVFDTAAPATTIATVPITGLQAGEAILAIDVRPATGQLYGLGSTSRLYVINPATGVARQVGAGTFATGLVGASFGFDFNPTVDRIRVVSDAEQNLRLHPDTGALAAADTALAPAGSVVGSAYTSNFAGATQTTLFGIDSQSDQLVRQGGVNGTPSPNGGAITAIGSLGVDTSDPVGFDITANDGVAYAALNVGGASQLYTIDLASGAATLVGPFAGGAVLRGLAILSRGVTLYGVTTTNQLVRFHSALPGTIVATATITGLQGGENVLGVDFRPATGELYALGSTSRLYRLDTATGRATLVGAGPFAPALAGTDFGFDFNPTVDRIRVVSDTGQNFRLHPDTAVVTTDTALNPAGSTIVGSAYTKNVDGATTTTLYGIDSTGDRLVRQGGLNGPPSPNLGLLTNVGALGVATDGNVGFDISPLDGTAFATLTTSGVSSLVSVDLAGGLVRPIAVVGTAAPLRALAAQPTAFHMAEGSTGTFFDTDVLVANPNAVPAPITVTYLTDAGAVVTSGQTIAAQSRATIPVDGVAGVTSSAFSSMVTSHLGLPLAVERTMRWDPTGYGMHAETASQSLSRTWYFAEGSQGFFDTFLLLTNPAPVANTATVRFLLENGTTVTRTYPLAPQSRLTVYAGAIAELVNQSFGMVANFAIAGAAERAMYFGSPTFNAGHESKGAIQPSRTWFLAEGATGSFFTTFLLIANPGDTLANVTLTYMREGGGQVTKVKSIPASSRLTINLALEDATLAATAVATAVSSDVPVVVERAQYWPFTPDQWYEAHNSFGVVGTSSRWALAEGRVGGAETYQTFVLLANPNPTPANVTLTFLRESGAPVVKTALVPANARLTITTGPGSFVPELGNERFGTVVASDVTIFVERAMYSNANGVLWAAGSNATATAVP